MKSLLIISAYNEGVKLESTCQRVFEFIQKSQGVPPVDFLLIDDASTDGVPVQLSKKYSLQFLQNSRRMGIGYALRRGYDYGIDKGYDILIVMAGNNKDNPEEIPDLIQPIISGEADFVQGSRYLPGGDYGNMPFYRRITTRYIHPWIFSLVAGKRMSDTTNGFRAIRTSLLKDPRLNLHQDWLHHYELEPYLFCMAIRLGYNVREVPVTKIYPDKKLGYSKMMPVIGWWSILKPLFYLMFKMKKNKATNQER